VGLATVAGMEFEDADLRDSSFTRVDLSGSTFRGVGLHRVRMVGVELSDVDVQGELSNVVLNGVDVAPLVEAELCRRDPDRARMRPAGLGGFRAAWDLLERRWDETVSRARALDPALLHESVGGEWSFVETLRHLVFATDAWVRRGIQGDPAPWDPLDLPWDDMPDTPGVPRDRGVRPSLDEVLVLRRDRYAGVRALLDSLTEESLSGMTTPVPGPGWPPSESFPVRECLLVVLNEEYSHRQFAERDLAVLAAASGK